MKIIYPVSHRFLSVLAFLAFILSTCEKPERDNPWDALSRLAPGSWAPENFEVERFDMTSARLTWTYSDHNIEGFKLDRRIGDGEWHSGYKVLSKEGRSFTDDDIVPEHGMKYYYRLYAFAGNNESASRDLEYDASAPLPVDFLVSVLSPTSVTLSWNYDHHGHDGFRLARKRNEEDWQESITELGKDDDSYNDQQVNLANNSYRYRLSVYIGEYTSENVEAYISRPTLSTTEVTEVTSTSATSGGNITDSGSSPVTARGIVWGTEQDPTLEDNEGLTEDGSGTGEFTSELTGLQPGITYYVRAYAINIAGTAYGEQVPFTAGAVTPTVVTSAITNITSTSATGGGNVTSSGGSAVTARGIVWSTFENPDINSNEGITEDGNGTGEFTSELTGLQPGINYYVRAYATNSEGTVYGEQVPFTTHSPPTVTTSAITNITSNSATGGGNVTSSNGSSVTARGVVWSTFENPDINSNEGITEDGTGTGEFTSELTGLQPGINYYVRAYATNSDGTAYGEQKSFETKDVTGTFVDQRDGQEYKWVRIGDQVWMAENLKFLPAVSPSSAGSQTDPHYYVYLYEGSSVSEAKATYNYQNYGVLYNWPAAMSGAGSSSENPSGVQGVCPAGWHVPSDSEWTQLVDYVVLQGYPNESDNFNGAGNALKSCRQVGSPLGGECNTSEHPRWNSHSTHYGTDQFGFSALPGGGRYGPGGHFGDVGNSGSWWTSTDNLVSWDDYWAVLARYLAVNYWKGDANRGSTSLLQLGFSVRCVRD